MRNALGPPSSAGLRLSLVTVAWKTAATWLADLASGLSHTAPRAAVAKSKRAKWLLTRGGAWDHIGDTQHALIFKQWISEAASSNLSDRSHVQRIRVTANVIFNKAHEFDVAQSAKAWSKWLHEGPAKGLSRHHRMTRVATGWIPSALGAAACDPGLQNGEDEPQETTVQLCQVPLSAQQEVDSECEKWSKEWASEQKAPILPWPQQMAFQDIDPLSVQIIKDAANPSPPPLAWGGIRLTHGPSPG